MKFRFFVNVIVVLMGSPSRKIGVSELDLHNSPLIDFT